MNSKKYLYFFIMVLGILVIKPTSVFSEENYLTKDTDFYSNSLIEKGKLDQQVPDGSLTKPLPGYTDGMSFNNYYKNNNIGPLDFDDRNWDVSRPLTLADGTPLILSGNGWPAVKDATNAPDIGSGSYIEGVNYKTLTFPAFTSSIKVADEGDFFNDDLFYPNLLGYGNPGTAVDYMLNEDNNIIIPSRYNTKNNDVWMLMQSNFSRPSMNLNAYLHVSDRNTGEEISDNNSKYYINTETKFKIKPASYDLLGRRGKLNIGSAISIANSTSKNISVNNFDTHVNSFFTQMQNASGQGWVPGGLGGEVNLQGFYRNSNLDNSYFSSYPERENDAAKYTDVNYFLYQKYPNNIYRPGSIGEIPRATIIKDDGSTESTLLYSTAESKFSIKTTRPYFIVDTNKEVIEYDPKTFVDDLGSNSFQLKDDGIDLSGKSIDVSSHNIMVRVTNSDDSVNQTVSIDDLEDFLSKESNADQNFTLTYLYAASDADSDIVGKLPEEIKDNTGAYAVPFQRNIVTPAVQKGKVITHFVDEQGNTLADSVSQEGNVGDTYATGAISIKDYALDETKIPTNATGTFTDTDINVTYVYKKVEVAPIQTGKVITHFVDEQGNALAEPISQEGRVGDTYATGAISIKDYALDETKIPTNATGTFTDTDINVTYVYKKVEVAPIQTGKVITHFVDEQGNKLSDSTSQEGRIGDTYVAGAVPIDNYILNVTKLPDNAIGKFTEADINVTYVYKKVEVAPIQTGKVITHFVDEQGNKLADSVSQTGNVGDTYVAGAILIDNYILNVIKLPDNAIGKFTEADINVTYVYKKVAKISSSDFKNNKNTPDSPAVLKNNESTSQSANTQEPKSSSSKQYPATGDQRNYGWLVIGSLLLFSLGHYQWRRTQNHRENS